MKRLVDEILGEMNSPNYVPDQAEALVLIAWQLDRIANMMESK